MLTGNANRLDTLVTLLGVATPNPDLNRAWRSGDEATALRPIPVGLTTLWGEPVWLQTGRHVVMVGMPGCGKSTALHSVSFAMCARHSPDTLNLILVTGERWPALTDFREYPHTAAFFGFDELAADTGRRLALTLDELLRDRAQLLHHAGVQFFGAPFTNLHRYRQACTTAAGSHLPPTPYVYVVIDNYPDLIRNQPAMVAIVEDVLRRGPRLGVFVFLTADQFDRHLDLLPYFPVRWVMRITGLESRALLVNSAGLDLPSDVPGVGLITDQHGEFRSFMVPRGLALGFGAQAHDSCREWEARIAAGDERLGE